MNILILGAGGIGGYFGLRTVIGQGRIWLVPTN